MPAPDVEHYSRSTRPAIGHVNLMVDTLIANASVEDLRAIVRSMLATNPPTVAASFVSSARSYLTKTMQRGLTKQTLIFDKKERHGRIEIVPTTKLNGLLEYTRSLYGAGMGFDGIELLTGVVRATSGLRWGPSDHLIDVFAIIDVDISQAIQSCKEELANGYVRDIGIARTALRKLRGALVDCRREVESWGGEFPFSRGCSNADSLQF